MLKESEQVLEQIRNLYFRIKEPITIWILYATMRKEMSSDSVRRSLIYLKHADLVDFDLGTGKITPNLSDQEKSMLNGNGNICIDILRIKECIRIFKKREKISPKPNDIAMLFFEIFGVVNMESLTRYIRKLAEEGKLERDEENRYDVKEIEPVGLRMFVEVNDK